MLLFAACVFSRREWIEAIQKVSEDVGKNFKQKQLEDTSTQSSTSDSATKGSNKVSGDIITSMHDIIMH